MRTRKLIAPLVLASVLLFGASPSLAHYEVKKGDTLGNIAYNHDTTVKALVQINPSVKNVNLIHIGDEIDTAVESTVTETVKTATVVTEADVYEKQLFAQLVEAEAKGESYAGKVAVASVVLNRVDSHGFPDSISEVIYQKRQFVPVATGKINQPASEDSKRAVEEVLRGYVDHESLFFYNPRKAKSVWLETRPTTTVIGNHTFKK